MPQRRTLFIVIRENDRSGDRCLTTHPNPRDRVEARVFVTLTQEGETETVTWEIEQPGRNRQPHLTKACYWFSTFRAGQEVDWARLAFKVPRFQFDGKISFTCLKEDEPYPVCTKTYRISDPVLGLL